MSTQGVSSLGRLRIVIAKLLMALTMALSAIGTPGASSDVVSFGDHYLMIDPGGVLTMWAESNGYPGLQNTPIVILGVLAVDIDHRVQL